MKKAVTLTLLLCVLFALFASCGKPDVSVISDPAYRSFEEALDDATDVVIAVYAGSSRFGERYTVKTFNVAERIYGDAPDTVDTVAYTGSASDPDFKIGKSYLLALCRQDSAEAYLTRVFYSTLGILIPADDTKSAEMYGEKMSIHAENIDFSSADLRQIITYIAGRTADNARENEEWYGVIRSDSLTDIVNGSPVIISVKADDLLESKDTEFMKYDSYFCTVTGSYKGDFKEGDKVKVAFLPGAVKTGREYTVAVKTVNGDGRPLCIFTSKNSLIDKDDVPELLRIING